MAEKEYIERGAVLADLDASMKNDGLGYVVGQMTKRYIKRQPAADVVEVRHGKWIPNTLEEHGEQFPYEKIIVTFRPLDYRCSLCGRIEEFKEPYCHCGAKMDGGAD